MSETTASYISIIAPAVVLLLVILVSLCRLYHNAGRRWWTALVPVYGYYVLGCEAASSRLAGVAMAGGWFLYVLFYVFPVIMRVPDAIWTAMCIYNLLYVLSFPIAVFFLLRKTGTSVLMSVLSILMPVPFFPIAVFSHRRDD